METNCKEIFCKEKALSLSDRCWKHMADREAYVIRLEEHNKNGHSMEGFYLKGLNAPSINLVHANLKGANLSAAVLKGASFSDAELANANLTGADLSGCDFIGADCGGANFMMSVLSGARFWHTDLTGADLAEANMEKCDFLNAALFGSNIYHSSLKEARFLTRDNFRGKGRREGVDEKGPKTARESYANIKQYFIAAARYNDVSWASYNENRMELRRLWKEKRIGVIPFFVMGLLCGWGERPLRATVAALAIIISYASLFFILDAVRPNFSGAYTLYFPDYVYYSTITFTTVGYGDFLPKADILFKFLAGSEAFVGIFMMGLFVFTLGRRYSSR